MKVVVDISRWNGWLETIVAAEGDSGTFGDFELLHEAAFEHRQKLAALSGLEPPPDTRWQQWIGEIQSQPACAASTILAMRLVWLLPGGQILTIDPAIDGCVSLERQGKAT